MSRTLYRSRKNRMIGGVAGGLAEYFDIDPVIVRIAFIISAFLWGFSFIVYIILWIAVPEGKPEWMDNPITDNDEKGEKMNNEGKKETAGRRRSAGKSEYWKNRFDKDWYAEDSAFYVEFCKKEKERKAERHSIWGYILIAIGALLLFDNVFGWMDFDLLAPLFLIILGGLIIFRRPRLRKEINS